MRRWTMLAGVTAVLACGESDAPRFEDVRARMQELSCTCHSVYPAVDEDERCASLEETVQACADCLQIVDEACASGAACERDIAALTCAEDETTTEHEIASACQELLAFDECAGCALEDGRAYCTP